MPGVDRVVAACPPLAEHQVEAPGTIEWECHDTRLPTKGASSHARWRGREGMTETEGYVEKPVMMRTTAPNEQLSYCVFLIEQQANADAYLPQGSGFLVDVDS